MRLILWTLPAALIAAPALASEQIEVMATVTQYNDDFNKGDTQSFEALCTPQTTIIDDFSPHAWQGANACADWAAALFASDRRSGITNGSVTLGKPWHVAVTSDRAYAVYPARYAYKRRGKDIVEEGVWTFALQKITGQWRIAGWAWAQH